MESLIKPKSPKGKGWIYLGRCNDNVTMGYEGHAWRYPEQQLYVISALEVAAEHVGGAQEPHYHISLSKLGWQRADRNEARFVKKCFDMEDSEEDNHVPHGFVRNFWLPVNENLIGKPCPCKNEETLMKENKGDFEWRGIEGKS